MSAKSLNRTLSFRPKKAQHPEGVEQQWLLIDAEGMVWGRLAPTIAHLLKGKHKPQYTPHTDVGDYVVVINADKMVITGNKAQNEVHYRHTGHRLKGRVLSERMANNAAEVLTQAVKNMLPRTPLGRDMLRKLKVYNDDAHRHQAQNLIAYVAKEEEKS